MRVEEEQGDGYSLVNTSAEASASNLETDAGAVGSSDEAIDKFRNLKGMGWIVTCLFIVGETAGGGLIAMPGAMVSSGLFGGVIVIFVGAVMCAYTGNLLSENWTILQKRWPVYRRHCRKPYPSMGLRALGPTFMTIVSCCLNVTQFGTAVVFILLASKNIESFLSSLMGIHIGFCYLVLIVAFFMLPFTMLRSPKDFWMAVIAAMVTTTIAVSFIVYGSLKDAPECLPSAYYPDLDYQKFFMCFGTVMFAYGGHGAFPTIQHDMKKPYHFRRSVNSAFLIIFCMYLPVSTVGYIVYGDSIHDSIIPSIQHVPIQQFVNILITLHVILALTIVFNPLNQELEELLKTPHHFGWQRVFVRSAMMVAVVIIAETVPNFGVLLDLVGGSTITLMALVFPVTFNFFTVAASRKYNGQLAGRGEKPISFVEALHYTPTHRIVIFAGILIFAIIGGGTATISAIGAMINSEFSQPCYAGLWLSAKQTAEESMYGNATELISYPFKRNVNCCGFFKNISRYSSADFCMDPTMFVSTGGSHG